MSKTRKPTQQRAAAKKLSKIQNRVRREFEQEVLQNGLAAAIFGAGVPGGNVGPPGTTSQMVQQVNEFFSNLRWYFISNFRQVLSEAYVEFGLIQTLVDVPVDDAFRGGVKVRSRQLSPEQLQELEETVDREDDLGKIKGGRKWARLFGGGGIVVMTDQDPSTPLQPLAQGDPLAFRDVDMWELFQDLNNVAGSGASPDAYATGFEYYSYYGKKLHKSRVIQMQGLRAPSFLRPKLRGWGFSVVEALVRSVNQYLEGTALIYELVDEAKIDVFGIKNLTASLTAKDGVQRIATRIQLANQQKDFQHALVMDAEDTYEQKTLTFAGLAEVMKEIRMQVASDLRMPLTKLFGISAAGFNSGEDDIEVYNAMVEATIRQPSKKDVLSVLELRCQQLFGMVPDDLSVEFEPLRVLGSEQEATVKEKKHNMLLASLQAGGISLKEYRDACNAEELLGIDLEDDHLPDDAEEVVGSEAGGEDDPEDDGPAPAADGGEKKPAKAEKGDKPKADKPESKKPESSKAEEPKK